MISEKLIAKKQILEKARSKKSVCDTLVRSREK